MTHDDFDTELLDVLAHLPGSEADKATAAVREALWFRFNRESIRTWQDACALVRIDGKWPTRLQWEKAVEDARKSREADARAGKGHGPGQRPCDCGGGLQEIRKFTIPALPIPPEEWSKGPAAVSAWKNDHHVEDFSAAWLRCDSCGRDYALSLSDGMQTRRDGSRVHVAVGQMVGMAGLELR